MEKTFGLVLCLVFVGVALSADSHCCMKPKLTGKGLIITATLKNGSSTPTMVQNSFTFDHDYDRKLERVNGSITMFTLAGVHVENYQVIRDFNQNKSYGIGDGSCLIEPLYEVMRDGCIPQNLTLFGQLSFGSGSETAHVNGYFGTIGEESWTMTSTINDCTLVSYTRLGSTPDGTKISETGQLVDVTQGVLSDPNSFNVPLYCKPDTASTAVGK